MNLSNIISQNSKPIRFLTDSNAAPHVSIEVCGSCNGEGHINISVFKGHTEGHDIEEKVCEVCGGSGRLKVTTTIKVEPYKPKHHEG